MKAKAARVLMLGTAPGGRGGVAAVVSVLRGGALFEREQVRYLATHAEGSRATKARYALGGFARTVAACAWARPAIVHAHCASRASFVRKSLLLLVARAAGCKTIFHLHGGGFRQFATEEAGAVMRRWIRHTLERSSLVIALSEGWAQFVRGFAPLARVAVLPNPVPVPPLPDAARIQPGRILFLGRIEPAKGIGELLEAAAMLAPRFPQLKIVLAGEGGVAQARARATALGILGRVELPGWLGPREREAELASAAIFCLPSHAEGLPMALLEAMAAGKAIVASSVGAIPEAVTDGDNGLLVPPSDAPALAAALARLLGDDALRAGLARRARASVAGRYGSEVVERQLSAIYRQLEAAR